MHYKMGVEQLGTFIPAAAVVLFLVIIFILFMHLYAKWFWWQLESADEFSLEPDRLSRTVLHDRPVRRVLRRGLDLSVLVCIPVLAFDPQDYEDGSLECTVCLSELTEGEDARILPKCKHGFHVECIDMWLQCHSTCPVCRNRITLPSIEMLSSASFSSEHCLEARIYPATVLYAGNQTQISPRGLSYHAGPSSYELHCPSLPNPPGRPREVMIEMPLDDMPENRSSLLPSATRLTEDHRATASVILVPWTSNTEGQARDLQPRLKDAASSF